MKKVFTKTVIDSRTGRLYTVGEVAPDELRKEVAAFASVPVEEKVKLADAALKQAEKPAKAEKA